MNYRHAYHAGNFADIFKHTLLAILLEALNRKPTPWCYFDTHAGAGRYDLKSDEAQRGDEAAAGIGRLWAMRDAAPAPVVQLCATVAAVNSGLAVDTLPRFYPGSPTIAASLARTRDRLILSELQLQEGRLLREYFHNNPRAAVHVRDGYEMLTALAPPTERRGLVLIDPPFEQASEFAQMLQALRATLRRWPEGVYALWYPLKDEPRARHFERELMRLNTRRVLRAEFRVAPAGVPGFNASSMVMVNPPWQSECNMETALHFLRDALAPQTGSYQMRWLKTEST